MKRRCGHLPSQQNSSTLSTRFLLLSRPHRCKLSPLVSGPPRLPRGVLHFFKIGRSKQRPYNSGLLIFMCRGAWNAPIAEHSQIHSPMRLTKTKNRRVRRIFLSFHGGREWDRTIDLYCVRVAL